MVAVAFYKLIKVLEYENVNPGQDSGEAEAKKFVDDDVPHDVARKAGRLPSFNGPILAGAENGTATQQFSASAETVNPNNLTTTYSPPQMSEGLGGMNGRNRVTNTRGPSYREPRTPLPAHRGSYVVNPNSV